MISHRALRVLRGETNCLLRAGTVLTVVALAACGGGDGGGSAPSELGTLAYVNSTCRDDAAGFTVMQELRVRRGDAAPITVARFGPFSSIVNAVGPCAVVGLRRLGVRFLWIGAFQRLGISPDGTGVIFEVSDDFNRLGSTFVPPEQEGIFFMRADGSGLRRLGRASRVAAITSDSAFVEPLFRFSPNGGLVGFTDMGPGGPEGQDAAQVFTLDVNTGQRTQVTHLPPAPEDGIAGTQIEDFLDDQTILLHTTANPDGINPDHDFVAMTVSIDGNELKGLPSVALPGGVLIPNFAITGARHVLSAFPLPGVGLNPVPGLPDISNRQWEVFINDGTNVLQLTSFGRVDTSASAPQLGVDGAGVFFTASVDLGANPTQACQIFAADALGGDVQQLTHFTQRAPSLAACYGRGCRTDFNFGRSQDRRTGLLLFASQCDPFETHVDGEQIFALRPDGSGLRQLTDARGVVRNVADRSLEVELPGPWAYGPYVP